MIRRKRMLFSTTVAAVVLVFLTGCQGTGRGAGNLVEGVGGFLRGFGEDVTDIGRGIADSLAQPRYPESEY